MLCSRCQTENPAEARFCRSCGAPLTAASAVPASPVAAPAVSVPSQKGRNPSRWPIAAGLLAAFAFLLNLAAFVFQLFVEWRTAISAGNLLSMLLILAAAVLFLVPTKKIAVLSSIPLLLLSFLLIITDLVSMLGSFDVSVLVSLLYYLAFFVLSVFYLVQTLVRGRSPALPAVHLGGTFLVALLQIASDVLFLRFITAYLLEIGVIASAVPIILSTVIRSVGNLVFLSSYAVASFSLRRKEG